MVTVMKHGRRFAPVLVVAAAGLLGGCDTVGNALGLNRTTPDAFQVVERAPLEVPPDFNLRPPQPGSPRPQELERDNRVTASVFGASGAAGSGLFDPRTSRQQSTGEAALLTKIGADQADPEIRTIVDRENSGVVVGTPSFLDRLLFWNNDPAQQPETQHQGAPPTIARTGSSQSAGAPGGQPTERPISEAPPDAKVILSVPVKSGE